MGGASDPYPQIDQFGPKRSKGCILKKNIHIIKDPRFKLWKKHDIGKAKLKNSNSLIVKILYIMFNEVLSHTSENIYY